MASKKLLGLGSCRTVGSPVVGAHSAAEKPRRKPFQDVEDKLAGTPFNKNYVNRNPRSGEILAVAPKPMGYGTRYWRIDYYHKLRVELTGWHITAYVEHNNGLRVVEASTKELAIARYLYKTMDVAAALNIGRVLGKRLNEVGISRVVWQMSKKEMSSEKIEYLLKGIRHNGVRLDEPRLKTNLPAPGTLPP